MEDYYAVRLSLVWGFGGLLHLLQVIFCFGCQGDCVRVFRVDFYVARFLQMLCCLVPAADLVQLPTVQLAVYLSSTDIGLSCFRARHTRNRLQYIMNLAASFRFVAFNRLSLRSLAIVRIRVLIIFSTLVEFILCKLGRKIIVKL